MVQQHHERLDGSGYPQGFAGEQIIGEARLLAVADGVEAMTSHRPYRPMLGIGGRALAELSEHGGVLYDAEIVDACIELFEDGYTLGEFPPEIVPTPHGPPEDPAQAARYGSGAAEAVFPRSPVCSSSRKAPTTLGSNSTPR